MHVKGRDEVAKRILVQAAACNIALILRTLTGAGTPRGAADLHLKLLFAFLRLWAALNALPDAQLDPTTVNLSCASTGHSLSQ